MSKNDEYFTMMESQIRKWDAEVDKLRARNDQMSADAHANYDEQYKAMRANRGAAHKNLQNPRALAVIKLYSAIVLLLTVTVFPALSFAQGGPKAEPIPYHSSANGNSSNLNVFASASVAVPAGKRLIVEYVSLTLVLSSGNAPYTTTCQIRGVGAAPDYAVRAHYLNLHERSNGTNGVVFTASDPVKMYLEDGSTPEIICEIGITGISLQLNGWISGQFAKG